MTDKVREFVIAAHQDLAKVQDIYAENPELIDEAMEWRPGQTESPLQAAAHTGQRGIAEFLLEKGATPNMVAYAMLGDEEKFNAMLAQDPDNINEIGAHNFSLMFHAAFGGNLAIIETIYQQVPDVDLGSALLASVMANKVEAIRWYIAHDAPLTATDFQGRTALEMAVENEADTLITLLKDAIGEDNLEVCDNCGEKGTKYLANLEGSPMGAHTKFFKCKNCDADMETRKVG